MTWLGPGHDWQDVSWLLNGPVNHWSTTRMTNAASWWSLKRENVYHVICFFLCFEWCCVGSCHLRKTAVMKHLEELEKLKSAKFLGLLKKNDPIAMGDCHSWQWALRKYAMFNLQVFYVLYLSIFIFKFYYLTIQRLGACIMEITYRYRYMARRIFSMVFVSTGLAVVHCRFALRTGRRRTISTSFLQSLVWSFGDGQLVVPEEDKKQQKTSWRRAANTCTHTHAHAQT